ncbi:DUF58 domain-containing protein [Chitinivorax sp. B]|uniref:DUF58 domain-containing protein n=1 Tax=Chitinivorax sp. B TaxID=2502235 RepID=UPI002016E6C0|nr:DUF58 domain-containing protein [Chitinivorax sp. B]
MISAFTAPVAHVRRLLFRPTGPIPGPIELTHRKIFIIPSRFGLGFGVLLLVLLVGSLNYDLSLGYALTFWLVGIGHASMYHCFRNQSRLSLRYGKCQPVFAGGLASFEIVIDNATKHPRRALTLTVAGAEPIATDVAAHGSAEVHVELPAPHRGYLPLPKLTLSNRYPLGLFYAWSYAEFDVRCLIYPAPEIGTELPPPSGEGKLGRRSGEGFDDFAGLRPHRPSDSPRHIAWKYAARDDSLYTKQFSGESSGRMWLDWQNLPAGMDVEARLSRLTAWVLQADSSGLEYGLRLPRLEITPGAGPAHRHQCLQALALFGLEGV